MTDLNPAVSADDAAPSSERSPNAAPALRWEGRGAPPALLVVTLGQLAWPLGRRLSDAARAGSKARSLAFLVCVTLTVLVLTPVIGAALSAAGLGLQAPADGPAGVLPWFLDRGVKLGIVAGVLLACTAAVATVRFLGVAALAKLTGAKGVSSAAAWAQGYLSAAWLLILPVAWSLLVAGDGGHLDGPVAAASAAVLTAELWTALHHGRLAARVGGVSPVRAALIGGLPGLLIASPLTCCGLWALHNHG